MGGLLGNVWNGYNFYYLFINLNIGKARWNDLLCKKEYILASTKVYLQKYYFIPKIIFFAALMQVLERKHNPGYPQLDFNF